MRLLETDICKCSKQQPTGRKYLGFVACGCGGLIVSRSERQEAHRVAVAAEKRLMKSEMLTGDDLV